MWHRRCGNAGVATQVRQRKTGRMRANQARWADRTISNKPARPHMTHEPKPRAEKRRRSRETPTRLQNQTRSEAEPARTDTRKPKKPTGDRAGGTRGHRRRNQQRACPATRREAGTMPKKRSTKKTDESKRAERKKLMDTDTYRQGDTPTQPESKISNRRGRPAPCRHAATQVSLIFRQLCRSTRNHKLLN